MFLFNSSKGQAFLLFDEYNPCEHLPTYGIYRDSELLPKEFYYIEEGNVILLDANQNHMEWDEQFKADMEAVALDEFDFPQNILDHYNQAVSAYQKRQEEITAGIWVERSFTDHSGDNLNDRDETVVSTERYKLWVNTETGERLDSLKLDEPDTILKSYQRSYIFQSLDRSTFQKWVELHYGKDSYDSE